MLTHGVGPMRTYSIGACLLDLDDPSRLIGELAEPFGLTLNGVKKHVGILETVDLVITEKVGRARECRLGPAQLENATGWIDGYRRELERRLDRFGAYVEERR